VRSIFDFLLFNNLFNIEILPMQDKRIIPKIALEHILRRKGLHKNMQAEFRDTSTSTRKSRRDFLGRPLRGKFCNILIAKFGIIIKTCKIIPGFSIINKANFANAKFWIICFGVVSIFFICSSVFSQEIKDPNVAGTFYPQDPRELSSMLDAYLSEVSIERPYADIFALISPHAGYVYSGKIASYGYKSIKDKSYKTIVIIGPSHHYNFKGVSIYPQGSFRTPLGDVQIDSVFAQGLLNKYEDIVSKRDLFQKEHSIEVQIPFLQKVLSGFKIVPILMRDASFSTCQKLSELIKAQIGDRKDILVIASTDMYHGYDYEEADRIDALTLSMLKNMDAQGLYEGLSQNKLQLCGGYPVVTVLMLAKSLGHDKLDVLAHSNSAQITGNITKGVWTVGYSSCVIDNPSQGSSSDQGEKNMLIHSQRNRLLQIARASIETYLKTGKKLDVSESDPLLLQNMGAFVTLNEHEQLRGCIGNLVGSQPLYLTVRDMAVEAAVGDPRFSPVNREEFKNIEIEISVLSPMKRVNSPDEIQLGKHGVLVRRGANSGVFLPQVATETGWNKEEFLSNLCAHKAGLPASAWKDKSTELYIFTAEVFSEKETAKGEN